MLRSVSRFLTRLYRRTVASIAFVPGIISLTFLCFSVLILEFDFSSVGKEFKSNLPWISLKDASTARSICTTIAGGIFSLSVFSFSMVMILLSQTAQQMSNRVLDKLIGNRFQQTVLGFYIGTIVYALFLLSTIRDIDTGVHVPAISAYLLIALSIVDIFLFIYFLHYVTQAVKYETIIHKIFTDTLKALTGKCSTHVEAVQAFTDKQGIIFKAFKSGIYQGFEEKELMRFCEKFNVSISFSYPVGSYLIKDITPLLVVNDMINPPGNFVKELELCINVERHQDVNTNFQYGFKQLMEIGVKALSPGINDPGTCVLSLQALTELFAFRLKHSPQVLFLDRKGSARIKSKESTFEEMFEVYLMPIWDYGKNDRLVQRELVHSLSQLEKISYSTPVTNLLSRVKERVSQM